MIALLCSVDIEAKLLLGDMSSPSALQDGDPLSMTTGVLAGQQVVLCAGGMGKVNAAHAATIMIMEHRPEALIVFGIGGAYPSSGAKVGDVAVAGSEIAGDEGVLTREGFKDTKHIGIPLLRTKTAEIYTTYPAPEALVRKAVGTLSSRPFSEQHAVQAGPFVTLSTCTGTRERARELEERHHALCENMEGAAAAHVALSHGIPWLEVRGISNIVEDRDLSKWDIPRAAAAAQEAVRRLIETWRP